MEQENSGRETGNYQPNERPDRSEKTDKLFEALAKSQGSFKSIKKDATNPHFKASYATLASIKDSVDKPLLDNGITISQTIILMRGLWVLETHMVHHSSSQFLRSWMPLNTSLTPQQFGSALTYYRRYCLSALLGVVADDDDDGNAANTPGAKGKPQPAPQGAKKQGPGDKVTQPQVKRMYAIIGGQKDNPHVWTKEQLEYTCEYILKNKLSEIKKGQYDWLESQIRAKGFDQFYAEWQENNQNKVEKPEIAS